MFTTDLNYPGQSVFDRAKLLSLNDFIEQQLGVTGKHGRLYVRYSSCPDPECGAVVNRNSVRLSVKNDTSFFCHRCGAKGSIVDAAMLIWGVNNALDAAKIIVGETETPPKRESVLTPEYLAQKEEERQALKQAITAIRYATDDCAGDHFCKKYLTQERGIPLAVIHEAMERRLLGFLPTSKDRCTEVLRAYVGDELLHTSGLWIEGHQMPWIVKRPLVFFYPDLYAAEFRLNRVAKVTELKSVQKGSTDYPWFWRGSNPKRALIVEGFIDLLSAATMEYEGHIIGIPGCGNWDSEWFTLLKNEGVEFTDIGFDDDFEAIDNPGQHWAGVLGEHLDDIGMPYHVARTREGDMNELLMQRRKSGWVPSAK